MSPICLEYVHNVTILPEDVCITLEYELPSPSKAGSSYAFKRGGGSVVQFYLLTPTLFGTGYEEERCRLRRRKHKYLLVPRQFPGNVHTLAASH
jgi:hypothetical protein